MEKIFSRWLAMLTVILMAALNAQAMKPILPYGQWSQTNWIAKCDTTSVDPENWLSFPERG